MCSKLLGTRKTDCTCSKYQCKPDISGLHVLSDTFAVVAKEQREGIRFGKQRSLFSVVDASPSLAEMT